MTEESLSSAIRNRINMKDGIVHVDAGGLHYKDLNTILRTLGNPVPIVHIENVYGQRYIGTDLSNNMEIHICGTPGNDVAAFLDGSTIIVHGNAQDGVGNTMNRGRVIVHGRAGDIVGHSMRGGEVYIREDVGYRCGIHMKEFEGKKPLIVVGGTGQDYLGEYMAGGTLIVLGLKMGSKPIHHARFLGTGMHGGVIYLRGEAVHTSKEVQIKPLDESDYKILRRDVEAFCKEFEIQPEPIMECEFTKLIPASKRPYGNLYVY
ncbi:MAG: hypothetical protein QG670_14 [Thermoproteota archaeon]|nr:hypothetical protein [Thermoproteota archaeon]